MTWGSDTQLIGMKGRKKYRLPDNAPGKHEPPALFAARMERRAAIAKARKRARTEVRGDRKFKVIRLPDHVGL